MQRSKTLYVGLNMSGPTMMLKAMDGSQSQKAAARFASRSTSQHLRVSGDTNYWSKIAAKQESNRVSNVTIGSEKDLDDLLQKHPKIGALSQDAQSRADLAKMAPRIKKYQYIMMDSGASLHVAKMEKHFPAHAVRETDAMRL